MTRAVLVSTIVLAMTGCSTTFHGAPKVSDGPPGCKAKCASWGMELVGMVAMGDYSDGCICQVPGTQPKADIGAPAAGIAIAGVWVQMEEERQRASQSMPPPHR